MGKFKITKSEIDARVESKKSYTSYEVKAYVTFDEISNIAENITDLPGVSWASKPIRNYIVEANSLSHVIGYVGDITNTLNKANLAQAAFGSVLGEGLGATFVAVALFFFAFSTILGWNLFAKTNVIWLFGEKAAKPFMVVALVFIFLGTLGSNDLVWELSDMFNNLMVIPNTLALFALSGVVTASLKQDTESK